MKTNSFGIAGFVLSLVALAFGWVALFGWIVWGCGAICSVIGLFKEPRGLAIAGTVLSCVSLFLLIFVYGTLLVLSV